MKRRLLGSISILVLWTLFHACIEDETSGFKTDGSPITITTADTIYDVELGEPAVIVPEISQPESDLELTYEWRAIAVGEGQEGKDSLRFIGTDKVLTYKFAEPGSFRVRLRVENKYGSTFKYFNVNVLSPYEQGILIVSNDVNDKGRLSFVRAKEEAEIFGKTEQDFYVDAFARVNPDIELRGLRDADISKMNKDFYQLILSSETDGKFYFLNTQNFLVENMLSVSSDLSGLRPSRICLQTEGKYNGSPSLFITRDDAGQPTDFAFINILDRYVYPDVEKFPEKGTYDKLITGYLKYSYSSYCLRIACCVDKTHGKLHIIQDDDYYDASEYLEEQELLGACFYDVMERGSRIIFATVDKANHKLVRVYRSKNAEYWNYKENKIVLDGDAYIYTLPEDKEPTLSYGSDIVYTDKYNCLFYNQGNKIYRWAPYFSTEPKLPTQEAVPLNADRDKLTDGDEITCMKLSPSEDYLYVCVYNPNAKTELKGKLLIVNTDNLKVEKVFEGVSDRAVQVMWKGTKPLY